MRVLVEVAEIDLEGDYGGEVPSVSVTCSRCEHAVEVYGTESASIKRGCVMLREECPNKEKNYYEYT